jgi:hypothetical protein
MDDTIDRDVFAPVSAGDPSPLFPLPNSGEEGSKRPVPSSSPRAAIVQASQALAAEAWREELAEMLRLRRLAQRQKYEAGLHRRPPLALRLFRGFQLPFRILHKVISS